MLVTKKFAGTVYRLTKFFMQIFWNTNIGSNYQLSIINYQLSTISLNFISILLYYTKQKPVNEKQTYAISTGGTFLQYFLQFGFIFTGHGKNNGIQSS